MDEHARGHDQLGELQREVEAIGERAAQVEQELANSAEDRQMPQNERLSRAWEVAAGADSSPWGAWMRHQDLYVPWSGVGPGWLPLLDTLLDDLRQLGWDTLREAWRCEHPGDREPLPRFDQIKEKYGTLRIYATVPRDMQARIHAAERASAVTCETCGAPGALRARGDWYVTRCELHATERGVYAEIVVYEEDDWTDQQ